MIKQKTVYDKGDVGRETSDYSVLVVSLAPRRLLWYSICQHLFATCNLQCFKRADALSQNEEHIRMGRMKFPL